MTARLGQREMTGEFRIIPRQDRHEDRRHQRWGILIENHPLGHGPDGIYLASWLEWQHAVAAAHCLGVDPYKIVPVTFIPFAEVER